MKPIFNREPLIPNKLSPLPLGAITPEDWLYDQLRTQTDGLTASLHDVWKDVGDDCAWLGGSGDGWERAPYYLDGLLPLAWELNDEKMKALAQRYIEWILASQREDGWFGPEKNADYWPLMVVLKVLMQYFSATNDKRVLVLMDKYFKYEYKNLAEKPMRNWAVARGGDNMLAVLWLYNITGQKYLLELCKRLRAQTLDWPNYFHTFSLTQSLAKSTPWPRLNEALAEEIKENELLRGEERPYFRTLYHFTHGVNVAMGLKTPGVINLFKSGFKEQGGFQFGWSKLMRYHGVANGIFTCDEHLSGANPTQGTETCTVVEAMFSLETLIGLGDYGKELPDILEKIAFNALPAAFTPDMRCHQYDQQVNQVRVSDEPRKWYNNSDAANLYGFAPHYGCCTANYHQGWPKFVASLWYATADGGLSAVSYAPCTVRANLAGTPVKMRVSGNYPFGQAVKMRLTMKKSVEFPLYLRVPAWARQPMIYLPDGEIMQVHAGETTCLRRVWQSGDEIRLELPMIPRLTRWYHQSGAVELGPLLMAFQPKEKWTNLGGELFAPDWMVEAESPWNWALVQNEPMKAIFAPEKARAFGKGEPAVKVLVKAAPVEWGMDGGNCASVPMMPKLSAEDTQVIELVPYGGTGLRIGQFPVGVIRPTQE